MANLLVSSRILSWCIWTWPVGALAAPGRLGKAVESLRQTLRCQPDSAQTLLPWPAFVRGGQRGAALEEYQTLKGLNLNLAHELYG
jgi:hypothetical protein